MRFGWLDPTLCSHTHPLLQKGVKKTNNNINNKARHQRAWGIWSWMRVRRGSICVLVLKCLKFFEMSQCRREKGKWSGRWLPWVDTFNGCHLLLCDMKTSKQILPLLSASGYLLWCCAFSLPWIQEEQRRKRTLKSKRVLLGMITGGRNHSFAAVILKM